jgi:capsular exopolysaccharide synthesis family protein
MSSEKSHLDFHRDRSRQSMTFATNTFVPGGASGGSSDLSSGDILEILFRRRRVILVALVLGIVAGTVLILRPRRYTAEGAIRVQPGTSSMYRTSPMNLLSGEDSDKIASETAIVQSRTLYLQVATELDLVHDPAFRGKSKLINQSLDDPMVRERVLRQMRKDISVTHSPKDEIIAIYCTTTSPVLSAKIVNTLIQDYIAYLFQMRVTSTQRASRWLIGQLGDLKQQIASDQTEITGLQKKLGVIGLNEQNAEYLQTQTLDSMTKAASAATIDRIMAEARFRYLQESDPNLIEGEVNLMSQGPGSGQNSLLQNLRNSQAQAASTYARLLQQFGPHYPEVQEEKAQLDSLTSQVHTEEQRILNQARISYAAASANERLAHGALERETSEAFHSQGDMVKYVLLLHDYESHRTLYEELVQRLREAGITSGLEAGEIDIVDLADLPALPNPPGPWLLLGGSLFVFLLGGCFAALAVDAMDTRVSTAEQAERATNLPLLGTVPHATAGKVTSGPHGLVETGTQYAEAVQSLRTSILLARAGPPPKVILVTSAVPGEGKSTTARNLAASFARHRARVVLIDCDLRKGTQAAAFGVSGARGVSTILTHQASLEDALHLCPGLGSLSVLAAGPHPPDPAVLMGSEEMAQLVRACAERFDYVILDSAPVLGFADVINIGHLAEAVVSVVREGFSSRKAVQEAAYRMVSSRLAVAGFVLNDVDTRAHAYRYGYGYRRTYEGSYRKRAETAP